MLSSEKVSQSNILASLIYSFYKRYKYTLYISKYSNNIQTDDGNDDKTPSAKFGRGVIINGGAGKISYPN